MVKGYNAQEVIKCSEWIEKCEAMEAQYNAVVAQNKSLQGELRLANKMIELILQYEYTQNKNIASYDNLYQMYKCTALQELEAEDD